MIEEAPAGCRRCFRQNEIRYPDKLIDELAKGKPMEKIFRADPGSRPG
jgi:hypothetical protein